MVYIGDSTLDFAILGVRPASDAMRDRDVHYLRSALLPSTFITLAVVHGTQNLLAHNTVLGHTIAGHAGQAIRDFTTNDFVSRSCVA